MKMKSVNDGNFVSIDETRYAIRLHDIVQQRERKGLYIIIILEKKTYGFRI